MRRAVFAYYRGVVRRAGNRWFELFKLGRAWAALALLVIGDVAINWWQSFPAPGGATVFLLGAAFLYSLLRENFETVQQHEEASSAAALRALTLEAGRPFLRMTCRIEPYVAPIYAQPRLYGHAPIGQKLYYLAKLTLENRPGQGGPGAVATDLIGKLIVETPNQGTFGPFTVSWMTGLQKKAPSDVRVGESVETTVGQKLAEDQTWRVNATPERLLQGLAPPITEGATIISLEVVAANHAYPPFRFRIQNPGAYQSLAIEPVA